MDRIIETERLILKTLGEQEAPLVLDYYNRNREFLEEWEPVRAGDFYTEEFHRKELRREQAEMEAAAGKSYQAMTKAPERGSPADKAQEEMGA
jgi:ribosomal-protein-alanine N-acetyltransferase